MTYEPLWIYPNQNPAWLEHIVQEFRIHPVSAQILVARGFFTDDDIHRFLYAKLPDLYDPRLFLEMQKATDRLEKALIEKQAIIIYGDNDVDGMTGTALLAESLKLIGAEVYYYIPSQNVPRGALFLDALDFAQEHSCRLMITVDCGITAGREIQKIMQKGIDVIVTDHHEPTEKLPQCIAVLNPKIPNQTYPNRDLTGVGMAFKLIHALANYLSTKEETRTRVDLKIFLMNALDLVVIGEVADLAVLLGENRILARYGLKQLQKTERMGLIKLLSVCGVDFTEANAIDIASKIGPRMNSLGRIADPSKGVELLLVRDEQQAEALANELDLFNVQRQKIEQLVSAEVESLIAASPEILKHKAIVLSAANWHPGVIPIITARIAKQYNRPTIIIAIDCGVGKGSIRTIPEFPLLGVLKKCSDLFINYGGHDFAAGLTIQESNIERFKKRFIHAANSALKDQDIASKLYLDAHANFDELTYDLLASLELFEPYGNGNPQPILYCDAIQAWPPKVIGANHLKFYLEQNDRMLEGIGFNMADRRGGWFSKQKNLPVRIAYSPQINCFHNKRSIQLLIRDIQVRQE